MDIISFIDDHNGFFMVMITLVYVFATIGILLANKKSAKVAEDQLQATRDQMKEAKTQFEEQLAEIKRQYEETKRLDSIPFLQIDTSNNSDSQLTIELSLFSEKQDGNGFKCDIPFEVKNIGRGTVKDILYKWENLNGFITEKNWFPVKSLSSGDLRVVNFTFFSSMNELRNSTAQLTFYYTDLFENWYLQKVNFVFIKNPGSFYSYMCHDTYPPELKGKVFYD